MELHCNLIDHRTVAIEPFFTNGHRSKITKMDGIFYSEKTPIELLNLACMRYASTLEGRIQAVSQVLHFRKPPFFIIPYDLGVFPTTSPKNPDCVWIFSRPFHIVEVSKGISRLDFGNDISILVNVSVHTLKQQQQRLHMVINYYRSIQEESKYMYLLTEKIRDT